MFKQLLNNIKPQVLIFSVGLSLALVLSIILDVPVAVTGILTVIASVAKQLIEVD